MLIFCTLTTVPCELLQKPFTVSERIFGKQEMKLPEIAIRRPVTTIMVFVAIGAGRLRSGAKVVCK